MEEPAGKVEEEKKPKPQPYVKDHAVRRMIARYERQDAKLIKRLEKIKRAILTGRDEVKRLSTILKARQEAREKYHADYQSV